MKGPDTSSVCCFFFLFSALTYRLRAVHGTEHSGEAFGQRSEDPRLDPLATGMHAGCQSPKRGPSWATKQGQKRAWWWMLVHVLYQNHKSEQYLGEMFHGKSTQEEGFKPVIVGTCCLQMPEFQPQELHPETCWGNGPPHSPATNMWPLVPKTKMTKTSSKLEAIEGHL